MFIDRIDLLLSEKHTNLTNLLMEIGLSTSKGTAWRKGSIPNGVQLVLLADYFNVSIDWLMGRTDTRETATTNGNGFVSEEIDLIRRFRSADDQVKAMLFRLLQSTEDRAPIQDADTQAR